MAFISKLFSTKGETDVAQPIKHDEKSQEVIMNLIESGVLDRESKVPPRQQCKKMQDSKSDLDLKFYTFVLVWLMVVLGLSKFFVLRKRRMRLTGTNTLCLQWDFRRP